SWTMNKARLSSDNDNTRSYRWSCRHYYGDLPVSPTVESHTRRAAENPRNGESFATGHAKTKIWTMNIASLSSDNVNTHSVLLLESPLQLW
ncbi:hypothetical protein J6590_105775, partial [Homalodisca vitripennis]